jgi:hypothetical protein
MPSSRTNSTTSITSGWPYEATIANSTLATDRNSGRVTMLIERVKRTTHFSKHHLDLVFRDDRRRRKSELFRTIGFIASSFGDSRNSTIPFRHVNFAATSDNNLWPAPCRETPWRCASAFMESSFDQSISAASNVDHRAGPGSSGSALR